MKFLIRSRLYAGFTILVVIAGFIGANAIYQQSVIGDELALRSRLDQGVQSILTINELATRLKGAAEHYRLSPSAEQIVDMEAARGRIEETSDARYAGAMTEAGRKLYAQMRTDARAMKPELEHLAASGKTL